MVSELSRHHQGAKTFTYVSLLEPAIVIVVFLDLIIQRYFRECHYLQPEKRSLPTVTKSKKPLTLQVADHGNFITTL
jgi:hypothetical protein